MVIYPYPVIYNNLVVLWHALLFANWCINVITLPIVNYTVHLNQLASTLRLLMKTKHGLKSAQSSFLNQFVHDCIVTWAWSGLLCVLLPYTTKFIYHLFCTLLQGYWGWFLFWDLTQLSELLLDDVSNYSPVYFWTLLWFNLILKSRCLHPCVNWVSWLNYSTLRA